ncbi:MAG: phage integrase N-terminal SAM-like domain-containing protein [Sedimentisphaerales bacterium]|nr:phage integrase N-terminal SAM-like domain-containing protein [Sedimentisphaerales bacterium]
MSRSRPASNPVSFHKPTNQYYVTRLGRRVYLGSDREQALKRYHEIGLGMQATTHEASPQVTLTLKELANRFIAAQRANWRNPETTLKSYTGWLGRLLADHPQLRVAEFTVELFASWKLSLKERGCSTESINHYLCAVRAIFRFAEDVGLIERSPRLSRVRNESKGPAAQKSLYTPTELQKLTDGADRQLKAMILLALNCGFGPKDIHDLTWDHIDGTRVTLPRSKTGISQTYSLWPETLAPLQEIHTHRENRPMEERTPASGNSSAPQHVFITLFGQPWKKDSLSEQFRKLCKKVDVRMALP